MTREMARRLEWIDQEYTLSRMRALQAIPGNPCGVEIQQTKNGVAILVQTLPYYNRIFMVDAETEEDIEPLLAPFHRQQVSFQLEIIPGYLTPNLARTLAKSGLYHSSFHTTLYGEPMPTPPLLSPDLRVQEIKTEEEFRLFLDTYLEARQFSKDARADIRRNMAQYRSLPGWYLYLGWVDNNPAGVGILFLKEDIGYLAHASTIPTLRRRGCQTALIHQRIARATAEKATLIVAQTDFGSTSQQNMERAGLKVAYTRALWTPRDF